MAESQPILTVSNDPRYQLGQILALTQAITALGALLPQTEKAHFLATLAVAASPEELERTVGSTGLTATEDDRQQIRTGLENLLKYLNVRVVNT